MIEASELGSTSSRAHSHPRLKVILVAAALGPLVGLLLSFAVSAKYTSQSLILVEKHEGLENHGQQVAAEDIDHRIARLREGLSPNRLQPVIDRKGLANSGKSGEQIANEILQNARIDPVFTDMSQNHGGNRKDPEQRSDIAGFYVEYTASTAKEAQRVCSELTSILLQENLASHEQHADPLAESRVQLERAKRNLDEQNTKLSSFKKQHKGQLPGDWENNRRNLTSLTTQLSAISQTINLAQQDKSNAESLLKQRPLVNRKSVQSLPNKTVLEKQLSALQSQLVQLQAQYADDHPDVVKTKIAIADLEKKLTGNTAESTAGEPNANSKMEETPEIHQLRSQIQHYNDVISEKTREQKRIQEQIKSSQRMTPPDPLVEQQYQELIAEHDAAQNLCKQVLANHKLMQNQSDATSLQPSERLRLSSPASLPDTPSFFPKRALFAAAGEAMGLALGLGIALWLELRRRMFSAEPVRNC